VVFSSSTISSVGSSDFKATIGGYNAYSFREEAG
jgi:hypothetical protein